MSASPLPLPDRLVMVAMFLAVTLLPLSYMREALRALRTGRLETSGKGVPVSISRSDQPRRFRLSVWGLLGFMSFMTAVLLGFALLVAFAP